MIIGTVCGEAILTIKRQDSKWVPFSVQVEDDTNDSTNEYWCVDEAFYHLETETLPLPDAAYELAEGECVSVRVKYQFDYTKDYWGEYDVELNYISQQITNEETL